MTNKEPMTALIDNYLIDIQNLFDNLVEFLDDCNVEITKKDKEKSFKRLLEKTKEIVAIRKGKSYYGVETDDRGYIINLINIDGILERQELPVDIAAGYYKYEKGNFILDEKMKLERR